MKRLLAILALALLASCTKEVPTTKLTVPSWACTQAATGETRKSTRMVYCGKRCEQPEEYTEHAIKISCEYYEWREE